MTEALMPQLGCSGGDKGSIWRPTSRGGARKGVEFSITIAMKNHVMGLQVLHRETKGVKLNGTTIIASKFTNGKQIANKSRNKKDVVKFESVTRRCAHRSVTR
jgi:hypothetical protein